MSSGNLGALYSIMQLLSNNKHILQLNVLNKLEELTIEELQMAIQSQPRMKDIFAFPMEHGAIVCGDPDSGKRIKIIQCILECSRGNRRSCRVLFIGQEEVDILAAAFQMCEDLQQTVGNTVGYKLLINSQFSDMGNVLYSTAQILMLSFLTELGQQMLDETTHLVVENADRRSPRMDLLLSLLREKIRLHPLLKLVLVSSNYEVNDLTAFFTETEVLPVLQKSKKDHFSTAFPFGTDCYYLDAILMHICTDEVTHKIKKHLANCTNPLKLMAKLLVYYGSVKYNSNTTHLLDALLEHCWFSDDETGFITFLNVLQCNTHVIDYQHSDTEMTLLMIACAKGLKDTVRLLLNMGANPYTVGKNGMTAMNWCRDGEQNPCWQLLNSVCCTTVNDLWKTKCLCQLYYRLHNPYIVNQRLVLDVISYICKECIPGKILVMLPDYTDVLECYELLRYNASHTTKDLEYAICHRLLTENEFKEGVVFPSKESNSFEVILVAEPMLEMVPSLNYIDYVVDTGLRVHSCGDFAKGICIHNSCLTTMRSARHLMWLAQRKCFFLYTMGGFQSRNTDNSPNTLGMAEPDLVLKALQCLKKSSSSTSIEQFFDSALTSPPVRELERTIELLSRVGAIERSLKVPTNLGFLLANLDIGIHLGKALLYATLFKCLDPVATIVAALKVGNPFVDPVDEKSAQEILRMKHCLHNRTYSDWLVLLRLYQLWCNGKIVQDDVEIAKRYRLKTGAMEAISNARVQLMSILRVVGIFKCGRLKNYDVLNKNSKNWSMVKACLTAGFYPKLAVVDYEKQLLSVRCGTELYELHPLSVAKLSDLSYKWVIYAEKQDVGLDLTEANRIKQMPKPQLMDVTAVSDWTVLLMCGVDSIDLRETSTEQTGGGLQVRKNKAIDKGMVEFILDRRYSFQLEREKFFIVRWLRLRLGALFRSFTEQLVDTLAHPDTDRLVAHIGDILHKEEETLMLPCVTGIETRPKIKNLLPMGALWNYTTFLFNQSKAGQTF
ncbi:3'-5' RNA helicase YTHDC2-like [Anopheles nili]|uniref:3'-5' RNA helicase YTHDC2-like n=1 Tax=Anopheles nili TaxID=185578 RepID=UPI00237B3631|nr:3'-5' RNA helicase YTHDC2-like [Anopheles nili]